MNLRAITLYLPPEEIDALETEAEEDGRSGVSAQIRFILAQRRKSQDQHERERD